LNDALAVQRQTVVNNLLGAAYKEDIQAYTLVNLKQLIPAIVIIQVSHAKRFTSVPRNVAGRGKTDGLLKGDVKYLDG